jgi:type II restriction/modification system DNA methylase subunit YeeA
MTPEAFIQKWRDSKAKEKSAYQEHFIDLCRLLGEPTPNEADPDSVWYCFEKGAKKAGGGDGWADVWKKGYFGMEYKGKGKNLAAALSQLQNYALALYSPPLLIVCDLETLVIHTAFTNAVQETHVITLDDLPKPDARQKLKWAFTDPERLRPGQTREGLTREAAERFGALAFGLHQRDFEPHRVAHFLNRILFCLFAEDCDLLPKQLFSRLLENATKNPDRGTSLLRNLFQAMANGGDFGVEAIDWFNGGLFNDDDALPLTGVEFKQLLALSHLDWSSIEPAIFGTLFERGLDPAKRSQLGAHYTDRDSIMRLIDPVIRAPLLAEWDAVKADIAKDKTKGRTKAHKAFAGFLERLKNFRVLDPACGSGNFLYLALQTLKDLEHQAILEAEALGLPRQFPAVGPEAVHGIELNPYAAELARVTVWIGEIQWMLQHGYNLNKNPILRPLETIAQRDAVLNPNGTEAEWPDADVIIGNPPFLGDKKMVSSLGEKYTKALRACYQGRVPGGADLVCYWFEKARAEIEAGKTLRAGLVSTNSIRSGTNRKVLERICETGNIYNAWSDEPWINEGAAVRVSLISFSSSSTIAITHLDGRAVGAIYSNLSSTESNHLELDLTKAKKLFENAGHIFQGPAKVGDFDISGEVARTWLPLPNPNGRHNSSILRPWYNGIDLVKRPSDSWIIDFGNKLSVEDACFFEKPFEHVVRNIKPIREINRDKLRSKYWWRLGRSGEDMRNALKDLQRYIATPEVSKHRLFVWLPTVALVSNKAYAIAYDNNAVFGVLHSRFHELWSIYTGSKHGVGNDLRYTPTTTFETFSFPEGVLTDPDPDGRFPALAAAARRLNELRENWLNPPEWVDRVPEVVPGYPDRLISKPDHAAELKKRTLTNLYNAKPDWLKNAHKALDKAVAEAYDWKDYTAETADEEILSRLLALNRARSQQW